MIKRLRIKFVCINMLIVTVMLAVILGMVAHSTQRDMQAQSLQMLQSVAASSRPGAPGEWKENVPVPYFTVQIGYGGEYLVMGSSFYDLTDEGFLNQVVEAAMRASEQTGTLPEHDLQFYKAMKPGGQMVAFMDTSAQTDTMHALWRSSLLIGVGSFGAFLVISILLAQWAVKPVERAWQQQRQFVADASHELKTPLTVILTNAELLGDPQCEQDQGRLLQSIRTMSVQMRGLVEGLLELARVDNEGARTAFSQLDLSRLAQQEILPFEPVFFEKGLELQSTLMPGLRVKGSASHLRQVLGILLDNAAKYAREGSCVEVTLKRQGRCAQLAVKSQGQTMTKAQCADIFKRFYRADQARSRDGSYGLGLPIAQGIVRDHGGKIWAHSSGGVNTFFVQLPLV